MCIGAARIVPAGIMSLDLCVGRSLGVEDYSYFTHTSPSLSLRQIGHGLGIPRFEKADTEHGGDGAALARSPASTETPSPRHLGISYLRSYELTGQASEMAGISVDLAELIALTAAVRDRMCDAGRSVWFASLDLVRATPCLYSAV